MAQCLSSQLVTHVQVSSVQSLVSHSLTHSPMNCWWQQELHPTNLCPWWFRKFPLILCTCTCLTDCEPWNEAVWCCVNKRFPYRCVYLYMWVGECMILKCILALSWCNLLNRWWNKVTLFLFSWLRYACVVTATGIPTQNLIIGFQCPV